MTNLTLMNDNKLHNLIKILKKMKNAVLAYSGGVDSTFLLKTLRLSGIRTLAVTASSEIIPFTELLKAKKTAEELVIDHRIIKTEEFSREDFLENSPERCFFCKDELFKKLSSIASAEGYQFVLDGSNRDDIADYRPGRKAAEKYLVRSPLIEAGFSKKEIRKSSQELGLSTWDKPAAPCLATRIPYGQRITREALKRVERAEDFLISLGFREIRVRDHGDLARIEVQENEINRMLIPEKRKLVSETLKSFGYQFISLDIEGYRSGSMNRMLHGRSLCKTLNS